MSEDIPEVVVDKVIPVVALEEKPKTIQKTKSKNISVPRSAVEIVRKIPFVRISFLGCVAKIEKKENGCLGNVILPDKAAIAPGRYCVFENGDSLLYNRERKKWDNGCKFAPPTFQILENEGLKEFSFEVDILSNTV